MTIAVQQTRWGATLALFLAGCTLALHVGKFPAALPLLVKEFDLSLSQAGNLVSVYALLIATFAIVLGMGVSRLGYTLFALIGVALCVVGSFTGMLTDNSTVLMMSRACEGFGWVFGAVAFPTLLSTLCTVADRPVVLGIWGSFMPVGGGFMMLMTPGLQNANGWRLVWAVSCALTVAGFITLLILIAKNKDAFSTIKRSSASFSPGDLKKRTARAALVCFWAYSFLYLGTTSFIPLLLVEQSGMELSHAIYWATLVMVFNAIGNIASGWLINHGYSRSGLITFASLVSGVMAFVMFAVPDPVIRIGAALLLTAISGVIPGTLFGSAPLIASSATGVGLIVGFMLTGAGAGQFTGPLVVSRVVEGSGLWFTAGLVCIVVSIVSAVFARNLRELNNA